MRRHLFAVLPFLYCGSTITLAETENAVEAPTLDNVTIIGHRRDPGDVPGSAHVVGQEELQAFLQADVMRVLRRVPGVYVQEEEGFGLRPNIGIRGSGLDRSSRIALLEDGVLIAPAPYAAPAAYYFPTQRRMHALEVLKGPAAIAVGPRTTGGAINLVSTPVPDAEGFDGNLDLRLGQHDTADAHFNIGGRGERFAWLVETVQAESDGFKIIDGPTGGDTGFDIEDYLVKLQFDSRPEAPLYQSLRLKGGYTDQLSNETYLGLTDEDFATNPNRRYAASAGDRFTSEHEQYQATYVIEKDGSWRGEVTAYRNNFERNWYKLDSVGGAGIGGILADPEAFADEFAVLTGAADSMDDGVVKRHNNRQYVSEGIQAQVSRDFAVGDAALAVTTGVRLHQDEEDRLHRDDGYRMEGGRLILTSTGAAGSQTNRLSKADVHAFFVDTEVRYGAWIITPGLRYEDIDLERLDFETTDPGRANGPTQVRSGSTSAWIPGLGALYRLSDNWRFLAGVYKGFNPPGPGSTADEETSLNVEVGARYSRDALQVESIWFVNDYDNLVGTVTASTGGSGQIGDQFDGGKVSVQGLELTADYLLNGIGGGLAVPLGLQYTWTATAEFDQAFESDFGPWGDVQVGDELPYVPRHQLRAAAGLEHERWQVNLAANWVDRMRAVAGQGAFLPEETIDSHVVWDLVARWSFSDALSTYVKVDNLFDETYVAARRPAGARPGLERTAYVGVSFRL